MFNWDDAYLVGVENVDAQHKHLFRIGNDAYELLGDKHQACKVKKTLQVFGDLCRYAIFHFRTEEEYMLKFNSQQYLTHRVEHGVFVNKIRAVDFNKIDENQEEYAKELFDFIYGWMLNHVLQTDKETFLSIAKELNKDPGEFELRVKV